MEHLGKTAQELTRSSQHLSEYASTTNGDLAAATTHARILLGCYRTDSLSDPQVFTSAVVAVLSKFPASVSRAVCDPTEGLPSKSKWLPSASEIFTACKDEQMRQDTIARYAAMPKTRPVGRTFADPANTFVAPHAPQYSAIEAKCTPDSARFWKRDKERAGYWVPLDWVLALTPGAKIYSRQ